MSSPQPRRAGQTVSDPKEQKRGLAELILEMRDKQRDLETRLAAAERDAERYRWLRTKAAHVVHVPWPGRIVAFDGTGAALDNAVDKALAAARGATEEPKP